MSKKTWLKEFQPFTGRAVLQEEAVEMSLMKWIGMLSKNRKKHKITFGEAEEISQCELCIYNCGTCLWCPLGTGSECHDTGSLWREIRSLPSDENIWNLCEALAKLLDEEINRVDGFGFI